MSGVQQFSDAVEAFYAHTVDATESPHTDLDEVPDEARIEFSNGVERVKLGVSISPGEEGLAADTAFEDTLSEGIVLRSLIERAMLDKEARVIPL